MLQYISFDLKSIGYLGGKNYHLLSMLTARKYEDMHESQIVLLLCSSYMHHCGGSFFMFSYAGPWGHLTRSIHAIQGRDYPAWSPQRVPFEGEAAKVCYCEGLYRLWQTKCKLKYAALWVWWNDLQKLIDKKPLLLSNIFLLFIT